VSQPFDFSQVVKNIDAVLWQDFDIARQWHPTHDLGAELNSLIIDVDESAIKRCADESERYRLRW